MASRTQGSADKNSLWIAIGRAIQMRRKELGLDPKQIIEAISLSPSYFRAIEAGSVAPPPGIAVPLAFVFNWKPAAVCETFCAGAYLSAGDSKKQAKTLFARGVAPSIMNLLDRDDQLIDAVASYFTTGGPTAPASSPAALPAKGKKADKEAEEEADQEAGGPRDLPWMFDIAINRMIAEVSAAHFSIDQQFSSDFVRNNAKSIRNVRALLSYVPSGTLFKESGFDFSFLVNTHSPTFWIQFVGPKATASSIKPDFVAALADLVAKPDRGRSPADLKSELERRIKLQSRARGFDLAYDRVTRQLQVNEEPGRFRRSFCNAWLYEISRDGEWHWVGFIDTFKIDPKDEEFDIVPLSLAQVRRINDTFFK
jgi:hypothetical protein